MGKDEEKEREIDQEFDLNSDLSDVHYDMFHKVQDLVNASWDSDTLKKELIELLKSGWEIRQELELLDRKHDDGDEE